MTMRRALLPFLLVCACPAGVRAQLPIIDMHLHAAPYDVWAEPPVAICMPFETYPVWDPGEQSYGDFFLESYLKNPQCPDPVWSVESDEEVLRQTLEIMERRNVYGVLSETPAAFDTWNAAAPGRFIPGIHFMLGFKDIPVDSLRALIESGDVQVFGEVSNAYDGIMPDDPRMEPYWALVEEKEVPVALHLGGSPPGEPHAGFGFRGRYDSPLSVEELMLRHPRLRLYIMHAGYPFLDDIIAVLRYHPQVYVDIASIVFEIPRPEFYRYLRRIVEAGYGNRVMFGSDQAVWPEGIEHAITAIEEAPFLSEDQKRDILYNNAARFLRLSDEEIARHHGG